jgi:anti-anti-sigma factor
MAASMSEETNRPADDTSIAKQTTTLHVSASRLTGYLQGLDLQRDLFRLLDQGYREIVLDLSNVELISSSIIGTLIGINRDFWTRSARLVLANVQPSVKEILSATRVDELFRFRNA